MFKVDTAETNRSVVIDDYEYETPRSPWRVTEVQALPQYRLRVKFRDGVSGEVDMSVLVKSENAGVFRSLSDPQVFADVGVIFGSVTWANGVDLAPDAMHDEIEQHGVWMLR